MLLQEPQETPYDLHFRCLGFPVRISAWFWLGAALFGFSFAKGLESLFAGGGPTLLPLLILWAACLFVSILVHELGHALAFRRFGIESKIVLYHFGGLAIPGRSSGVGGRSRRSLTPKEDMWVSFAGPLLQVLSAVALIGVVKLVGYGLSFTRDGLVYSFPLWPVDLVPGFHSGQPIDNPGLYAVLVFYLFPSVAWALLNLLPVWPLDGGQIASSIVQLMGRPPKLAFQISMIAAIGVALYAYRGGDTYLAIMFAMLGINSYQLLQQFGGREY